MADEELDSIGAAAARCGPPAAETDLLLALTGFTTLLELNVIEPRDVLTAVDRYLDRLFTRAGQSPGAFGA